jgi:hypothetical protein
MQSKYNHARPMVLRELSLLRALGASLRISSYRSRKPRPPSLPLSVLPQPDALAALARHGGHAARVLPDKSA